VSSECCYRCGCPVVVTSDDYGPLCETCESGLWRGAEAGPDEAA
jgi:hypothetical protein